MIHPLRFVGTVVCGLAIVHCGAPSGDYAELSGVQELQGDSPTDTKDDGLNERGISAGYDAASTRVWKVLNQWEDRDTAAAKLAGMAWDADSGLNWDQKYALWIGSLKKVTKRAPYSTYDTFELTTPWGKTLPSPYLDCADTALFFRASFAAWYNLPFYVRSYDPSIGARIYFGHFGIRTASQRWGNSPQFNTSAYPDYSNLTPEAALADWPTVPTLRKKSLTTDGADRQSFWGSDEDYTGAYLDEAHLNKKAAYFIYWLLAYNGSANLAQSYNTFNLKPSAINTGDVLIHRRHRQGTGHTMVVVRAESVNNKIAAEIVWGTLPPAQATWTNQAEAKSRFLNSHAGGPGADDLGDAYAAMGGGLKRFRVTKKVSGRWANSIMDSDEDSWIDATDLEAIAHRITEFSEQWGEITIGDQRDALLNEIQAARAHLRNYPASCAAREKREEAFASLYLLMGAEPFSLSNEIVDLFYRRLEDYVFAPLVYSQSKTCCWNSSTSAMFDSIMAFTQSQIAENRYCERPRVFKATEGGYTAFAKYAQTNGTVWQPWNDDESCAQAGVVDDAEDETRWTPYCDIEDTLLRHQNTAASSSDG